MTQTNDPPVIDPRLLEAGGSLALSIEGLSGDAADEQDPKAHAGTHESGAVDVLDAQALANFNHAANHAAAGGDPLSVEALDFAGADGEVLSVSGGSLSFETPDAGVDETAYDSSLFPQVLG